uniref:Uncharacterized protein n=1 Tax=viral metagenome TaxID=1070528 RepID=A0A6C0HNK3_9ZZZZ
MNNAPLKYKYNNNNNNNNNNTNTNNNSHARGGGGKDMNGLGGPYNVYKYYNEWDDDTIHPKKQRCMCIDFQDANDFNKNSRCEKTAIKGSDFCDKHQNCVSYLRNFLSGSEPEFQPQLWSNPYIEGSHNCYSYFLNRQMRAVKEKCQEICLLKNKKGCPQNDSECSDLKQQPGDYDLLKRTGSDKDKQRIYRCPQMQKKILTDNASIYPIAFNKQCPANYYKGAMVIDSGVGYGFKQTGNNSNSSNNSKKGEGNTFHFYRQDNDGKWSHKPGISSVDNKDASNKLIYVPHFANRDYRKEGDDDSLYYNEFCGYYCIPTNQSEHKKLV